MTSVAKLKEIIQLIIAGGSIVYFFGFLTINSYLARFGLASFDVVNARYVVAGIFSLACVAIALTIAWVTFKRMPMSTLFDADNFVGRFFTLAGIAASIESISFAIATFFNTGRYQPPLSESFYHFSPIIPKYDAIGEFIARQSFGSAGYDLLDKIAMYLYSYVFLLLLVGVLIVILYGWTQEGVHFVIKKVGKTAERNISTSKEIVPFVPQPVLKKPVNRYIYLAQVASELLLICIYGSLAIWSYIKVLINLYDFNSLGHGILTTGLLFAWLYGFVFSMYIFLNFSFPKNEVNLRLFKLDDLSTYENVLRQMIAPVLGALVLFGWAIFPRIPFAIGGGEPREIEWNLKDGPELATSSQIYLLDETNDFIFAAVKGTSTTEALEIPKSEINYISTHNTSSVASSTRSGLDILRSWQIQ